MVRNASDNVKDYFKHASLTPIPGQLNYETLAQLQKEVCANGQSVPCSLGGGNLVHLCLVTPVTTYAHINPTAASNRLAYQPALPAHVQGDTQYHIQDTIRQYHDDVR